MLCIILSRVILVASCLTCDEQVQQEHAMLMKADQAAAKRSRKERNKTGADGDDVAGSSAQKRLSRLPSKRRRILKAKRKNSKNEGKGMADEDHSVSPASKSSKKDELAEENAKPKKSSRASPASASKTKKPAEETEEKTNDHASPASASKSKRKAEEKRNDHASPASSSKSKRKAEEKANDHASPASASKSKRKAEEKANDHASPASASKSKRKAEDTSVSPAAKSRRSRANATAEEDTVPASAKSKTTKAKPKRKAEPAMEEDPVPAESEKPKAKPKAKAKAGSLRPAIANVADFEPDEYMMERFLAYGRQCYSQESGFDAETRKRLRACLASFERTTLVVYWTRPAVALKFRQHARNKDFFYIASPAQRRSPIESTCLYPCKWGSRWFLACI